MHACSGEGSALLCIHLICNQLQCQLTAAVYLDICKIVVVRPGGSNLHVLRPALSQNVEQMRA